MTESSQPFARPRRRTLIATACLMLAGLAGSVAQELQAGLAASGLAPDYPITVSCN